MVKDNIYNKLIQEGRVLVRNYGAEFLTARKLSKATGISVGTIYNQFENMDNYILEQNIATLNELLQNLQQVKVGEDKYKNLNLYVDAFVKFVLNNKNMWFVLYNFHINTPNTKMPTKYMRKMVEVLGFWKKPFDEIFNRLSQQNRKMALQVLWLSMFSVSSYLTKNSLDNFSMVNRNRICKLLLNIYLAGLKELKNAK